VETKYSSKEAFAKEIANDFKRWWKYDTLAQDLFHEARRLNNEAKRLNDEAKKLDNKAKELSNEIEDKIIDFTKKFGDSRYYTRIWNTAIAQTCFDSGKPEIEMYNILMYPERYREA